MKPIPFYENYDATHCLQCSLRGALEYFDSEKKWTWPELEELTGKKPGLFTWMFKSAADIPALGYDVILISDIDLPRIADEKDKYVIEFFGKEVGEYQLQYTDMEFEEANIRRALANKGAFKFLNRSFNEEDIRSLLQQGYLIIPALSSDVLYGNEGNIDHSVLVHAVEGDEVIFDDNGGYTDNRYKAGPNIRVPLARLVKAAVANGKMEGLIAIRPNKSNAHA